jgi:hypothetical protein
MSLPISASGQSGEALIFPETCYYMTSSYDIFLICNPFDREEGQSLPFKIRHTFVSSERRWAKAGFGVLFDIVIHFKGIWDMRSFQMPARALL